MNRIQRTSELLAVGLLILLTGCGQATGPQEIAAQWLTHLESGRFEEAYGLLSPAARTELERLAVAQQEADSEALTVHEHETPGAAFFRSRAAPMHLGGVAPLPAGSAQYILKVQEAEDPAVAWITTRDPAAPLSGPGSEATLRLKMVKTAEGWHVDLLTPRQ